MLKIEEAQAILLENAKEQRTIETETLESLGGFLAENILADRDLPPFDRAMMDGYAVRSEDLPDPGTLALLPRVVAAGVWPEFTLEPGQCVKIMTGAPVPRGADAVQKIEEARSGETQVEFLQGVKRSENVDPRGQEIRMGQVAAPRGTRITPAVLGVIGTFGRKSVRVFQFPSVSVLTTGTEIVEFYEAPGVSQIRNSNSLMLLGLLWRLGIEGRYRGIVADTTEATVEALRAALDSNIILLTGGASVGDFDLVKTALGQLDATILFDKVAIKPGRPVTFARIGATAIFSLPGNPVSAAVTFHMFVEPYLRKVLGSASPLPISYRALLAVPFTKHGPRRHCVACTCVNEDGEPRVRPIPMRGSGDLVAFAKADCLMITPEGDVSWPAGEEVAIIPLEDPRG